MSCFSAEQKTHILLNVVHFICIFRCEKCGDQLDSTYVKEENDRLIEDLKSLDPNDPAVLDDFLRQHATVLPESNQLSREVQYRQVTLFKQVDQQLLDHNALLKKSYLCEY